MPKFALKPGQLPHTLRDDNDGHKVYVLRPGVVIDVDKDNAKALKFLRNWTTLVVELPEPEPVVEAAPKPEPAPEPKPEPKPKAPAKTTTRKRRTTKSTTKGE